ncbi:hypothetical protein Kpol_292p1, partial [Vanderwaltozyma polyspora DSM 70294]
MEFNELYESLADPQVSVDSKLDLLTKFKGHVKKELVNVKLISKYFDALLFVIQHYQDSNIIDPPNALKLLTLAHSALCYLIKRVAMQSPIFFSQPTVTKLLFYLVNLVPQEKRFWLSSIRAIEAIYLISPSILQNSLKNLCLNIKDNENTEEGISMENDLNKTILLIEELVKINTKNNRNPMEILNFFNPIFIDVLNNGNKNIENIDDNLKLTIELIKFNLKKYYNDELYQNFINQIENDMIKQHLIITNSDDHISTTTDNNNTNNNDTNNDNTQINNKNNNENNINTQHIFNQQFEIDLILKNDLKIISNNTRQNKLTTFKNYNSFEQLSNDMINLLQPFQETKETEQNWKLRQANILKFREIVNGNLPKKTPIEFISICKELQFIECISKAILSLRTTLSLGAFHLIREFCENLNQNLDSQIIDQIFTTLKTSLSSTKKITSQNSLHSLVILLLNSNFSNKLFNICFTLVNEKNVSPRICSSILLRLILIRFNNSVDNERRLDNLNLFIEEWLIKGIADAQTSVRESMRLTFWYYFKCYPSNARKLLTDSFSSQLKKAIELSIPPHLKLDYQPISTS